VARTSLHCSFSTQRPLTLACGKGTARGPAPKTYGFALADAAVLALSTSASGRTTVVTRRRQPSVRGAGFAAAQPSDRTLRLGDGSVLTVAGTHVVCVVSLQSGRNALTCGLTVAGSGAFRSGTFFAILTDRELLIGHKVAGGAESVLRRDQP
jgi:hypothetical protein